MGTFLQLLASSLLSGFVMALMAVGLSLNFGVGRVVNLAHGSFYTLGAYLAFTAVQRQMSFLWSVLAAVGLAFLLGQGIDHILVRPIRPWAAGTAVLTLGLSIVAEQAFLLIWGPWYQNLPTAGVATLAGIRLGLHQVYAGASALALFGLLFLLLRAEPGRIVRMTARDPEIATLSGIDVDRVQELTSGVAAALSAAAGALLAPTTLLSPTMGRIPLLFSLAMVVLGGAGRLGATFLAALLWSLAGGFLSFYLSAAWTYIALMVLLTITLVIRPQGLLPLAPEERR